MSKVVGWGRRRGGDHSKPKQWGHCRGGAVRVRNSLDATEMTYPYSRSTQRILNGVLAKTGIPFANTYFPTRTHLTVAASRGQPKRLSNRLFKTFLSASLL